jgi:hypothetical protein
MLTHIRKHGLRPVIRTLWFRTWVIDGYIGKNHRRIRMLFAGEPADKAYLCRQLFTGVREETQIGKTWGFEVPAQVARHGCDLSLIPTLDKRGLDESDRLRFNLPCWTSGFVNLTAEAVTVGQSSSRRRDLRKLRKQGLTCRVTTDPDDLIAFYRDMYVPSMADAHGDGALLMRQDHMLQRLGQRTCELLWILENDRPIAGSLIAYDPLMPRLWSSGILNANPSLKRKGVGTALYLLSFQHLFERGHKRINLGRSRPFLNDGAAYFKRRFGPTLFDPSPEAYELTIVNPTAPLLDSLTVNPFVFRVEDELYASAFVRRELLSTNDDWETIVGEHLVPGIERVVINLVRGSAKSPSVVVPDKYADRIVVRDVQMGAYAQPDNKKYETARIPLFVSGNRDPEEGGYRGSA